MGDVDWATGLPDGWQQAVESWPWHPWVRHGADLGWYKFGECPRCGHTMSVYQERVRTTALETTVSARCNCTHPNHAGRPDQTTGCGVGSVSPVAIQAVAA
jgi:hypothetical protein